MLGQMATPPGGILLAQTLLSAPARRQVLASVPLRAGMDVVDIGTGFGVLAFELAHLDCVSVTGVDLDNAVLDVARSVGAGLSDWLKPGSTVRFRIGDAIDLPLADESADLVTARLVLQHLSEPVAALRECARVLRPGGFVHVFDVDDGLAVTYPEALPEFSAVEQAYAAWQASLGGDRMVGRKLASYMAAAGLEVVAAFVLPQAHYGESTPGDVERSATAARLTVARDAMVAAGMISESDFDRGVRALLAEPATARFRVESQVVAVATKL